MAPQVPLLTLIVHLNDGTDRRIPITQWRTVIGRSSKCDIKLVAKQVSKLHAAIEIADGIPWIRDLGSRNGVELNGHALARPEQLRAGDTLVLGEARLTVDPSSTIFQPPEARAALAALLAEEEALRARSALVDSRETTRSRAVGQGGETVRARTRLVGRPVGNAAGEPPVLRVLRTAGEHGPQDIARIEAFRLALTDAREVWIKPNRNIDVLRLEAFVEARDVWIDEPEDFGGPGAHVMIIARSTYYLPRVVEVGGLVEAGRTPDGRSVYTDASRDAPIVIGPAS